MTTQARTEPGTGADAQLRPYGQYMLVRKLAEGGMAEIFLAKRLGADGFERNVVIKRMLPHLSALPDFVEMFRDEARLAAKLQHPNVVQIHELGEIEGCYYICMEYLPGEDFSTTVRTSSYRGEYVPVPLVMRVLADAARGLHYAHDFTDESGNPLNIVHRDISPSNLYVTYEGQVKVLDFGIAKAESRLAQTRTGVVKGKYVYMAPEQARGGAVDRRADVFSLGVSLYEAVTHVRPFARDNDLAVLNALLDGDFQPPRALRPDLSPDLEAVILKAMAYEPAHRYATAGEFADALEALLARESNRPTGSTLAAYLRQSFGEERYTQKTRIPTLTKLSQSGITIPVMNGAGTSGSSPAMPSAASEGRTSVVASPSATGIPVYVEEPRSSRKGLVVGIVAACLMLAGGAFVVGRNVGTTPAPNPVATPDTPAPNTAPAPAPAVAPTAVAEAQQPPVQPSPQETSAAALESAVAPPAEAPEAAAPVKAPVRTTKARVTLEAGDIQRVVSKGQARISTCFEQYKSDLPSDQGEVKVLLSIFSSGRTNAVTQGPLAKQPVGRCLEKQVERLRFPAHLDKEVTVVMPFAYRVTR
jgi:serine/threonine-protein kinase